MPLITRFEAWARARVWGGGGLCAVRACAGVCGRASPCPWYRRRSRARRAFVERSLGGGGEFFFSLWSHHQVLKRGIRFFFFFSLFSCPPAAVCVCGRVGSDDGLHARESGAGAGGPWGDEAVNPFEAARGAEGAAGGGEGGGGGGGGCKGWFPSSVAGGWCSRAPRAAAQPAPRRGRARRSIEHLSRKESRCRSICPSPTRRCAAEGYGGGGLGVGGRRERRTESQSGEDPPC